MSPRRAALAALLVAGCAELAPGGPPEAPPAGAPGVRLAPIGQVDFGVVPSAGLAQRTLHIESTGPGPLEVRRIAFIGAHPGRWSFSAPAPLPARLAPGEALDVTLAHEPCADLADGDPCRCPVGDDSALLQVETDARSAPETLAVFATAEATAAALTASPAALLDLVEGSSVALTLVNTGCAPAQLTEARLTGPGGLGIHGAAGDLHLEGCAGWPCRMARPLCPAGAPECPGPTTLRLGYRNRDAITEANAELHLRVEDERGAPVERVWLVRARGGRACPPTEAWAEVSTPRCTDAEIRVTVQANLPIEAVAWRWLFTPVPVSLRTEPDPRSAAFTPSQPGIYLVGATLTFAEACGAATEVVGSVQVGSACP